jgi:hypothetical protein
MVVVVPVYLAVVLLRKGMQSVGGLVRPVAALVPDWMPAERLLSLLLVLFACFLLGAAVRTRAGRAIRERFEIVFFERLPGYGLLRSLTQRRWCPPSSSRRSTMDASRSSCRPDPARRVRLHARTRARANRRHPVQRGDQVDLTVRIGVERPRGRHATPQPQLVVRARATLA